ncbi:MAG: hypothetical protein J6B23_05530 [Clostridia bacterium]|nr:hypothetical protein [Clostridia bacterium]
MKNKTNKLVSILLILTMLIGITSAMGAYAEDGGGALALICPARDDLPEGAKVRFAIEANGIDNAASYKLMSGIDGINYTTDSEYDGDAEYVSITVKPTQRYYIIKAYDETGNELATSQAVVFGGKREKAGQTIWNLDMEDENLSVISNGLNRYLSADGTNILRSNGDALNMHTGDDDNTVTIENTDSVEDGKNGRSLCFTRNGNSGNCQINSGWAKFASGIAVYSADIAANSYGTRTMLTGASSKSDGGNQWFPMVEMRDDGNVVAYLRSQSAAYTAPGVKPVVYDGLNYVLLGTYEPNKWYNVKYIMNISRGTLDIYFDGEYVATDMDRVSTTMTPARFTLSNSISDGVLYADNIKAYAVEHIAVNPGLSLGSDASGYALCEGTRVKLDITSTDMEDVASIELLESTDGEEYNVIETFSEKNVSTIVELERFASYYMAVAYDSNGEVIKKSEVLQFNTNPVVVDETLWDIDFEDEKFTSSAEYRYLGDETGTALSMAHSGATSTLTAHTGSDANDITIEYSGDESHGSAVKLQVTDEKQVQFNEFRARTTGGTVIGEWDIRFDSFPDNNSKLSAVLMDVSAAPDGTGGAEKPTSSVSLSYNGDTPYFTYHDGSTNRYIEKIEIGKWYNLKSYADLDNGLVTFLIDGKFAFSKSFDTSLIWIEKYVIRLGNCAGCEVWVDNFKVQRASVFSVPEIKSVTNDENSLYIEFANKLDAKVFSNEDSKIRNISVEYDGNVLDMVACEPTDNPNILRFVSEKKVFTSVPLNIEITVPYIENETMKCSAVYAAPPAALDVTDMTASYNGNRYSIEATLHNASGSSKTAVMVAVFYDTNGDIVAVRPSAPLDNVTTGSRITLSGNVNADTMHIFFIDNWASSKAIKNVVYKR